MEEVRWHTKEIVNMQIAKANFTQSRSLKDLAICGVDEP